MSIATVSSKGQITLPVRARRALGIQPHDRVEIEVRGEAILVRSVPDFFALEGFLGPAKSMEDERNAVEEVAAQRHARRAR